jgi:hypothetical protein
VINVEGVQLGQEAHHRGAYRRASASARAGLPGPIVLTRTWTTLRRSFSADLAEVPLQRIGLSRSGARAAVGRTHVEPGTDR